MREKILQILCPKCGRVGFVSKRWVTSSYYPKHLSLAVMMIEAREVQLAKDPNNLALRMSLERFKEKVVGSVYRGGSKKHLAVQDNNENIPDRKTLYKVTYHKYQYFYVGHYDKEKYEEQMARFRAGKIKSRSNGRKWCKLPTYLHRYRIIQGYDGKYIRFVS